MKVGVRDVVTKTIHCKGKGKGKGDPASGISALSSFFHLQNKRIVFVKVAGMLSFSQLHQ